MGDGYLYLALHTTLALDLFGRVVWVRSEYGIHVPSVTGRPGRRGHGG